MANSSSGVHPEGCKPGGSSESFILAPWSKVEEWRPHHPPCRQFGAPEVFFPAAPLGCPCLCLNGTLFVMLLIFFFFLFSLSFSFPFLSFFFWHPFNDLGGGEAPKASPGYAPAHYLHSSQLISQNTIH